MNKVIDLKMKEAAKAMQEYEATACALAQAICDQMKAEKGWDTTWHLGDYEAGIDTITISASCCCFDEACDYEMKIRDALEDCNVHGPSITVHCSNHNMECAVHKRVYPADIS